VHDLEPLFLSSSPLCTVERVKNLID